jgi:hypothetical protein
MKSQRKRASTAWAFVIALGIVAGIGGAVAQQVNEDAIRKAFADADVNGDGILNVDEYDGESCRWVKSQGQRSSTSSKWTPTATASLPSKS